MSMGKHLGRSRAIKPSAESLEGRQLLSATVSGTDTAGDQWTLTLKGKGTIQVVKQDDSTGSPGALNSATEIKSINLSGTDPNHSVLTETVKKAAGSDGRVFFDELNVSTNKSFKTGVGLGILAINMPDFWLGFTGSAVSTSTGQPLAEINIPDGVQSLRFGGVDATKFFGTDATTSPLEDGQNDQFLVNLGIPVAHGTSIVVDKVVSASQAATASTTTTPNSPTQKSVIFDVAGRINLFQANEIDGSTTNAPALQSYTGGTIVASFADPSSAITGELGYVRVGGNATNFSVVTNNTLANMYIGGETNNVSVLTPNGSRNFYFGKGADTTSILTHSIENLYANRGMVNSNIVSSRQIGDLMLGGDVDNSTVLSGYVQNLATVASTVETNLAQLSLTTAVTIATPTAQAAGMITAFIAGNVTNSVFAASDAPYSQLLNATDQTFGDPQDAFLPLGKITARVEGSINNPTETPSSPKQAFYAQTVDLTHGVVVPPHVVEEPLPAPATPIRLPGIPKVFPATAVTTTAATPKVSKVSTKAK